MTDNTTPRQSGDVHRLLDEAFAGIPLTPEVQDLKEEVRANLMARVADLETEGRSPADAARQAVDELGDVRELVGESVGAGESGASGPGTGWSAQNAAYRLQKVRPRPAFVVRIVIAAIVATAALLLGTLAAFGVLAVPVGVTILLLGIGATGVAWIVGDSVVQETTANHPMPSGRGAAYALATFLTVYGLGFGGLVALAVLPLWGIVFAAVGLVAGVVLFAFLGATQTNRHKAWLRQAQRQHSVPNRFEEEPESAARFGIYTAVIWLVAFALFVVLSFTVGWLWSWLALLGGFVVMMLVLAQMLFGSRRS
jgi:MFS family permease